METPENEDEIESLFHRRAYVPGASSGSITPPPASHRSTSGSPLHSPKSSRSASPARSGAQTPDSDIDIVGDPDFVSALDLAGQQPAAEPEPDDEPADEPDGAVDPSPRALQDDPLVRSCYITAYLQHAHHHVSDASIALQLKSDRNRLLHVRSETGKEILGLDTMATTRLAAQRRLGLDPDKLIDYYFVCDQCWHRHPMSELDTLPSPECTHTGCSGTLYHIRNLSENRTRRVPQKILPTSKLIPAVRRMMRRPGKIDELNEWRREGDAPGPDPPLAEPPGDGYAAFPNGDHRLHDITDGWGFRAVPAFLRRQHGRNDHGHWEFEDVNVHPTGVSQRFVALPNGLLFVINIDWYVF